MYRLITTILDPKTAPAACCWPRSYAQRWEIESTLDEIKTHLRRPPPGPALPAPPRRRAGDLAFLLVHHALRDLMHQAAQQSEQDPDRISFTRTLRVVRRHVTDQAALSTTGWPGHWSRPCMRSANGCLSPRAVALQPGTR